jgi:hypothetical protein
LLSTLFVVLFSITSIVLTRTPRRKWIWVADFLFFTCALFTYDQTLLTVLAILAVRLAFAMYHRRQYPWPFALAHFPYAAALAVYIYLRMKISAGSYIVFRANTLQMLRVNISTLSSYTLGKLWLRQVAPLYAKATISDWFFGILVAATIGIACYWIGRTDPGTASPVRPGVLLLALMFFIASYAPVWIWYIAPRHHYLPSIGLFAGGGVALGWILDRLRSRTVETPVLTVLCAAIMILAVADRGESRYWEEAFTMKSDLFADLKPDLAGKQILVLEDFPSNLGPAFLISPHDAMFGPSLLYHGSLSLAPQFTGSISGTRAPGGIFLHTNTDDFRYYPTENYLIARYSRFKDHRLQFDKNPVQAVPYSVISSTVKPGQDGFAARSIRVKQEGEKIFIDLIIGATLPPRTYLTAIFNLMHGGEFRRWGTKDRSGDFRLIPVLLSEPNAHVKAAAFEWSENLRLTGFPETSRLRAEFFAASVDNPPIHLGDCETTVGRLFQQ